MDCKARISSCVTQRNGTWRKNKLLTPSKQTVVPSPFLHLPPRNALHASTDDAECKWHAQSFSNMHTLRGTPIGSFDVTVRDAKMKMTFEKRNVTTMWWQSDWSWQMLLIQWWAVGVWCGKTNYHMIWEIGSWRKHGRMNSGTTKTMNRIKSTTNVSA